VHHAHNDKQQSESLKPVGEALSLATPGGLREKVICSSAIMGSPSIERRDRRLATGICSSGLLGGASARQSQQLLGQNAAAAAALSQASLALAAGPAPPLLYGFHSKRHGRVKVREDSARHRFTSASLPGDSSTRSGRRSTADAPAEVVSQVQLQASEDTLLQVLAQLDSPACQLEVPTVPEEVSAGQTAPQPLPCDWQARPEAQAVLKQRLEAAESALYAQHVARQQRLHSELHEANVALRDAHGHAARTEAAHEEQLQELRQGMHRASAAAATADAARCRIEEQLAASQSRLAAAEAEATQHKQIAVALSRELVEVKSTPEGMEAELVRVRQQVHDMQQAAQAEAAARQQRAAHDVAQVAGARHAQMQAERRMQDALAAAARHEARAQEQAAQLERAAAEQAAVKAEVHSAAASARQHEGAVAALQAEKERWLQEKEDLLCRAAQAEAAALRATCMSQHGAAATDVCSQHTAHAGSAVAEASAHPEVASAQSSVVMVDAATQAVDAARPTQTAAPTVATTSAACTLCGTTSQHAASQAPGRSVVTDVDALKPQMTDAATWTEALTDGQAEVARKQLQVRCLQSLERAHRACCLWHVLHPDWC
jgi:hypothetical protein